MSLNEPTFILDSSKVPSKRRAELYQSYFTPNLPFSVDALNRENFSVYSEDWRLPGLVFSSSRISDYKSYWNVTRPTRDEMDLVAVKMVVKGHLVGSDRDNYVRIETGDIYVVNSHWRSTMFHSDSGYYSLYFQSAALGHRIGEDEPFRLFRRNSPEGTMLGSLIRTFAAEVPRTPEADMARLVGLTTQSIAAILSSPRPDLDRHDLSYARNCAVFSYVESRLRDPQLSISQICKDVGASRATLFRIFAEHGGIQRYIMKRRLKQAFDELATADPSYGVVRRVGERWGFDDPQHFSRAFRRQFGLPPSDMIVTLPAIAEASEDAKIEGDLATFSNELMRLTLTDQYANVS